VKATRTLVDLVRTDRDGAPGLARRLVESMALALQGSILVREAPPAVADGFVLGRLGPDRCFEYGSLPSARVHVAAIAARA
jgi:putative acyl-CoA dehydrogenase